MDALDKALVAIVIIGSLVIVGIIVNKTSIHPCIRSHYELVHHDSYTSLMPVGKVMVPIHHNARDQWERVCDERK